MFALFVGLCVFVVHNMWKPTGGSFTKRSTSTNASEISLVLFWCDCSHNTRTWIGLRESTWQHKRTFWRFRVRAYVNVSLSYIHKCTHTAQIPVMIYWWGNTKSTISCTWAYIRAPLTINIVYSAEVRRILIWKELTKPIVMISNEKPSGLHGLYKHILVL